MITSLFFDVDGTIYDETHAKIIAEMQTAKRIADHTSVAFPRVYERFLRAKDMIIRDLGDEPDCNNRAVWYEEMLKTLPTCTLSPAYLSEYYWQTILDNISLYHDFACVIEALSRKYALYVITDELLEIQMRKLKKLDVLHYFKNIISSTHIGATKPDRRLFAHALQTTGTEAGSCAMIGDCPSKDIRGANAAGIKSVWLKRGKYFYSSTAGPDKPDIILTNYLFLEELL